ncbi:MAG TPA: bifunctional hydroxymethylpyrimidine kinase/phosphomethylpyrimidine kinase [Armatimonadota bacterium]|nr:bifunctional hydroxymethylpyrimidine kinase/phosphomethylpyrimidine kinase [Armatimonadota bacterium]
MKLALTIAGSDSSGGAGIQADLKVFADLGVYGLSVVTAVTAQNSLGVQKINKVPQRIVAAQIDSVVRDMGVDACKIGMLFSEEIVSRVAERIVRREIPNVVLDPVIFAKDGSRLLLARAVQRMRQELIPKCLIVTPNLVEAAELAKIQVTDLDSVKEAAKRIHDFGPNYVLIKGGHLDGEPVDMLYDGSQFVEYRSERVEGPTMHGTGCVFSAAITARLARGDSVQDSIKFAKDYIVASIKKSVKLGKGQMWYFTGGDKERG